MGMTRISSKGQVVIPKEVREARGWESGLELEVIEQGQDVLLRPVERKKKYAVRDLRGILKYDGPPVTLEDMKRGVDEALRGRWSRKPGLKP